MTDSSPAPVKDYQWWITNLPRLLMATASILLERLFLSSQPPRRRRPLTSSTATSDKNLKDRVMVQVLLWLTASLTSPSADSDHLVVNPGFEAFLHALFFANLMGIGGSVLMMMKGVSVPAAPTRFTGQTFSEGAIRRRHGGSLLRCCCPHAQSFRNEPALHLTDPAGFPSSRQANSCNFESVLSKLPPSIWVALVLSYLDYGRYNNSLRYLSVAATVFVISSLGAWGIQKYQARVQRRQRNQQFPNILPLVSHKMEEHNWHKWTVQQVIEWLSKTLVIEEDDLTDLTSRLAWEGVDGAALEYLNADALRHMDIPYGIACRILEHVKTRLIRRYPYPTRTNVGGDDVHEGGSYPSPVGVNDNPFSSLESKAVPSVGQPYLDGEELEQARNSMMQRFGFHLPELPKGKSSEAQMSSVTRTDIPPEEQPDRQNTHSNEATTMEDALLSTMPPHIRDIIQRKPELWEQVQAMNSQQKDAPISDRTEPQQSYKVQADGESPLAEQTVDPPSALPENQNTQSLTNSIPSSILQNLPPKIQEVAKRNPKMFMQMLNAKQRQGQVEVAAVASSPIAEETEEDLEQESDEMAQLIPRQAENKPSGRLRQRPGY